MTDGDLKQAWDYAWNYFAIHAEQRLKTFHFYLLVCAAIVAGGAAILRDKELRSIAGFLYLFLAVLSFIFWKLDVRNRELVKNGEAAIKHLESEVEAHAIGDVPHVLRIMLREHVMTERRDPWRYSHCLNGVFLTFGTVGTVVGSRLIILAWFGF
jgi:hypothetical protein